MFTRHDSKAGPALLIAIFSATLVAPLPGIAADNNMPASSSSPTGTGSDTSTTGSYVKDSYITAKVKAALARDKDVTARNIKVETDGQGMVTLSGQVKNQMEADKAVADARTVEGVTSVTSNLQVK